MGGWREGETEKGGRRRRWRRGGRGEGGEDGWESYLKFPECIHAKSFSHVQLFATPMDCSPPVSSVHGIPEARLLRVSWTERRSNQSILEEINPEYSLEGLMLKLKLQYFGHLMRRADSLEKNMVLGKIEGGRRRG